MTMTDEDGNTTEEEFNMRRNFYNKPLATFNWDWTITENLTLNTSVYGSAGRGGGTGPRGRNYDVHPYQQDLYSFMYEDSVTAFRTEDGYVDFDAIVDDNQASAQPHDGSVNGNFVGQLIGSNQWSIAADTAGTISTGGGMIRRASMNSHDWVGAISNLEYKKDKIRASVGLDLRRYKGYHYRAMNNLMGFDAYYSGGNRNNSGQMINTMIEASPFNNTGLNGPKIDYYNVGLVNWVGVNGLVEYNNNDNLTAVVQAGFSNQSYQREDYFDQPAMPISDVASLPGGYIKGGANYNIDESSNVFFNAGLISRQPNFDAVFPNYANNINEDLENEQITSFEIGYGFRGENLTLNVNAYATTWGNRFVSQSVDVVVDTLLVEGTAQFADVDVQHNGIEVEANYYPVDGLKLTGMLSLGDWRYTKDFEAEIFDDNQQQVGTATLFTNGAKVGDAAQLTGFLGVDYRINRSFNVDLAARYVDGLYADYSINSSAFLQEDNLGALQLPSYALVDLGVTSRFSLLGTDASFRVNVNNLFDTVYIAESNTNIHAAEDAPAEDLWNGVDKSNFVCSVSAARGMRL